MRQFILLFLLFNSCILNAEYFIINNYEVNIEVQDDGSFDVEEIIDLEFFEQRRGIIWSVPIKYVVNDQSFTMKMGNIHVDDWKYKTYKDNGYFHIKIGDANIFVDGKQQYRIQYTVYNAYLWHDNKPEFYWNIIGTEWNVPIEHIDFQVTFPEDLQISNRDYTIYSGPEGATENLILLQKQGNKFIGESTRSFQIGEGVSLAVKLEEGFIEKPVWYEELWKSNQYAPLGLGSILLLLFFWNRNGKRDRFRERVPLRYEAPEGYSAAELGFFVDHRVNQRDLLALLPEWGEKGYIHISRSINPKIDEEDALIFERIKDLPPGAPEYQRVLFNGIFDEGDTVILKDLKNKIYVSLAEAHKKLKKYVKSKELYDPDNYRIWHSGWMFLAFFLALISGIVVMILFAEYILGILLIIAGIIALVIHFLKPKLSEKGIRLMEHIRGFRRFLEQPDESKLADLYREDEKYFERMFPFAMAFGLDQSWSQSFSSIHKYGPSWYHDTDAHGVKKSTSLHQFSDQFQPKVIQSAFQSQPASNSSSSGSFGGGSSGGGFGGGGGSSW